MNEARGAAPPIDLAGGDLAALPAAVEPPTYARQHLRRSIVHIGVGGFHRAHLATYVDDLCRAGHTGFSIVGSGVTPRDAAMADVLDAQDGLYTLIERGGPPASTRVIGSIVDYVFAADHHGGLVARISSPEVSMVSLTITEGGYPVDEHTGAFDSASAADAPAFQVLAAALERRRASGAGPLSVVSCDNVIGNGDATRTSTVGTAALRDPSLAAWIDAEVAFPNSMVDRITPATTDADRTWLRTERGVIDRWPVVAEPFRQWVVEDTFAAGAPPFADVGAVITTDVEPYEVLKLRLLNAAHSCLAYLSALAGFELIDQVMADADFFTFARRFMRDEAIPTLPPIRGVDAAAYADDLLERFANPAIGDQIARLCLDGSSKFPKFLLPTVRAQLGRGGPIELSSLALAAWCRYLRGVDDAGRPIELAADPKLDELTVLAAAAGSDPRRFLGYQPVFGDDLVGATRFVDAFSDALRALARGGVRSSLDIALTRGPDGRDRAST